MKTFSKILTFALLASVSCQKLDYPEPDTDNTISALKCLVYYDASDMGRKQELNVLEGTWNPELGAVSFTFPDEPEFYNDYSLTRCRLEAVIPATAIIEETDAAGNVLGTGLGGFRDLRNTTVYFAVTAADGSQKWYQASFRYTKQ